MSFNKNKKINILITSAGRRSYLINYFKKALKNDGEVFAANSSSLSTAFITADHTVVTPLIYDSEYIPFLLNYCRMNQISAIISLFDIDLPVLAKNRELFKEIGVKLIVAEKETIDICNDKWKTYQFLDRNGFKPPKTYLSLEDAKKAIEDMSIGFPLILKPRWGIGSAAIYTASSMDELDFLYEFSHRNIFDSYLKYESEEDKEHCVLIQEKINGQEYGMDIFNDLDSNYAGSVVKKKLSMRAGETDCALTVKNDKAEETAKKLGNLLRHVGNLDVDFFEDASGIRVLEMNARFGGGYPFSHAAGADLPLAIIKWLKGETIDKKLLEAEANILGQKDITIVKQPNMIL